VERWQPDLEGRRDLPVFIAHGRSDPVIGIGFAHQARKTLQGGGLAVDYHESDAGHQIAPAHVAPAQSWLAATLPGPAAAG
jgi:phospholipase/carboxylesterase